MLKWRVVPVNMLDTHTNLITAFFGQQIYFYLRKRTERKQMRDMPLTGVEKSGSENCFFFMWSGIYNFIIINSYPMLFYIIIQK